MTSSLRNPSSLLKSSFGTRPKRAIREVIKYRKRKWMLCEELPQLEDGWSYDLYLTPKVGVVSIITAIAELHGPVDLTGMVFSFSETSLKVLDGDPNIKRMTMHVDGSCERRTGPALELAREIADVRLIISHAKVIVLTKDDWGCVIQGSSNLSKNRGIENINIHISKEAADAHIKAMASFDTWKRNGR